MNNLNQQTTWYLGITLIVIGIFALLHLWWLLPFALTIGIGAFVYLQQRQDGNTCRAVQGGLWLVGLGTIFLLRLLLPIPWLGALLLLAGASLLLRGHEHKVDTVLQQFLSMLRKKNNGQTNTPAPAAEVPIEPNSGVECHVAASHGTSDTPSTGETTRL